MHKDVLTFGWRVLAILAVSTQLLTAQTITGVVNEGQYYARATFTVVSEPGFDITATLNEDPVPVGTPQVVTRMDFYELSAFRTPSGGGATSSNGVHFIILSNNRGTPERGLIEWTPYPLISSTAAELVGARLDLIVPQDYPQGLEIPVVAWVRDAQDNEVRVNGHITAAGFEDAPVRVLRGAGSGFLPPATDGGTLDYAARLLSLANDKTINIDAATTWTPVAGNLVGNTTWAANSRIHLNGSITVPAGSSLNIEEGAIVKIDPGVNITNSGSVVINGTLERPVVLTSTNRVTPEVHTHAWGGFVMRGGSLVAHGAILAGGGSATSWSFSPGASHRSEQAVLMVHSGSSAALTNSAVINTAGQVANGYNSDVTCDRTLLQKAITAGEYVGGTIILNHAAVIEFPEDNGEVDANIADADYDAIYFTTGTHILLNTLIGFAKDDAIDSGSGGAGTVVVSNCWLEAALHEAMAWSGGGRVTDTYRTVAMNSGQGFECGWSDSANSPLCHGEDMLLTGNAVGARFGDNYDWTYNGQMWVSNSLILHNYRDVWGYNWDDWTYRVGQMDVQNNLVTQDNPLHPNNVLWNPAIDGGLLAPFMTTPTTAPVGIGIATWNSQSDYTALGQGVPVRLSSFTTQPVSVHYSVQDHTAATLDSGTLTFTPGETVKFIPVNVANPGDLDLIRVSLSQPVNGELTGAISYYYVNTGATEEPDHTILAQGSTWKYHNLGQNLGTAWRASDYDDSAWPSGPGPLGNGDGNVDATLIDIGPSTNRHSTIYFRTSVVVEDPSTYEGVEIQLRRDDGAVVYLNGTEVWRSNMPAGTILYSTFSGGNTGSETTYFTQTIPATALLPGANVIAVEVHQDDAGSSDLHFDLALVGIPPGSGDTSLIAQGSVWKYNNLNLDLGTAWIGTSYNDSTWPEGPAELGNGDGNEATMIDIGPDSGRYPTIYFRKTITVADPGMIGILEFGVRRDDGAVVYLNGTEVYRDGNVPPGSTHFSYATDLTPSETAYEPFTASASLLQPGDNVIAVEVHQESDTSSDISFDLELIGAPSPELKMVNFGSDFLLYWLDPMFQLESSDTVSGAWNPAGPTSPVEVSPTQPSQFFRLKSE